MPGIPPTNPGWVEDGFIDGWVVCCNSTMNPRTWTWHQNKSEIQAGNLQPWAKLNLSNWKKKNHLISSAFKLLIVLLRQHHFLTIIQSFPFHCGLTSSLNYLCVCKTQHLSVFHKDVTGAAVVQILGLWTWTWADRTSSLSGSYILMNPLAPLCCCNLIRPCCNTQVKGWAAWLAACLTDQCGSVSPPQPLLFSARLPAGWCHLMARVQYCTGQIQRRSFPLKGLNFFGTHI